MAVKLDVLAGRPVVWPKVCACCFQQIPMGSIRVEGSRGLGKQLIYFVPCCESCRRHLRVRTLGIVAAVVFCLVGLPTFLTPFLANAPGFVAVVGLALCLAGVALYQLAKWEEKKFVTEGCASTMKPVRFSSARWGPAGQRSRATLGFVFQNAKYAEEFPRANATG